MKICLIGPTYPYRGGISQYTTSLSQHLRDRHQVRLYSYTRQYPRLLFPGRTDRDPSCLPLKAECQYLVDPVNPWTWLRTFWEMKRDDPDLLILQWWVPYWTPTLAAISFLVKTFTPIKVLYICHNIMPHDGGGILDRSLARFVLRHGDHFIVHSEKDLERLQSLLPGASVRKAFIPPCSVFNTVSLSSEEAKRDLGLRGRTILFFGFVRPYKGLEVVLRALPDVVERVGAHLLVVGEFWTDESVYTALIRDLGLEGHVTIVNRYVPNEKVGLYFAASDVVVLPYVEATQSAVVPIAYSFHKPVITTDVGGLAEVVRDGVTGLIVPPRDSVALAKAMIRYFEDDLGRRFVPHIRAQMAGEAFSWGRLVQLIEEFCPWP